MSDLSSSGKIVAIGIGSAGSRIVSELSKQNLLIDRFVYVSCDSSDFPLAAAGERILMDCPFAQKLTPAMVRGLAIRYRDRLRTLVEDSKIVFVVAGLGGATGSGLAPIAAEIATECGAVAVGVVVMPFEFEKKLRFYAGLSLRKLRSASRGVVVIDNDVLLRDSGDATLREIYGLANEEVVKSLSCLLSKPSDASIPVGLNKVLGTVLQDGYCLLGTASSCSTDKTEEALARAVIGISKKAEASEASHAVVVLSGDSSVSGHETGIAVKGLASLMGNDALDVEYSVGYGGASQLQVSVLASGFKSTKYDEYDPLAGILGDKVIDSSMDFSLPAGLEKLSSCE